VDERTLDEPTVPRVIDRLRAAWLSDAKIQKLLAEGTIQLGGQTVTDLEQPAPRSVPLVLRPN